MDRLMTYLDKGGPPPCFIEARYSESGFCWLRSMRWKINEMSQCMADAIPQLSCVSSVLCVISWLICCCYWSISAIRALSSKSFRALVVIPSGRRQSNLRTQTTETWGVVAPVSIPIASSEWTRASLHEMVICLLEVHVRCVRVRLGWCVRLRLIRWSYCVLTTLLGSSSCCCFGGVSSTPVCWLPLSHLHGHPFHRVKWESWSWELDLVIILVVTHKKRVSRPFAHHMSLN